jgi:hypothetical protein
MRHALIIVIVVVCLALIVFVRGGADFPIVQILPFVGGGAKPLIFEAAGIALIAIAVWGYRRLRRPNRHEAGGFFIQEDPPDEPDNPDPPGVNGPDD